MAPKLTIELVPETCWFSNVRTEVSSEEWNRLRTTVYASAKNRCEICGGRGPAHPVECHEVWEYDDEKKLQRLVRMIALCPDCHTVKHFGFANIQGRAEEAAKHLARVNGWDRGRTDQYIEECFKTWEERSLHQWKLDISVLESTYGLSAKKGNDG